MLNRGFSGVLPQALELRKIYVPSPACMVVWMRTNKLFCDRPPLKVLGVVSWISKVGEAS